MQEVEVDEGHRLGLHLHAAGADQKQFLCLATIYNAPTTLRVKGTQIVTEDYTDPSRHHLRTVGAELFDSFEGLALARTGASVPPQRRSRYHRAR